MFHLNLVIIIRIDDITVIAAPKTQVTLKIVHPLLDVSQKIDETTIDDAENLHVVMSLYNLA